MFKKKLQKQSNGKYETLSVSWTLFCDAEQGVGQGQLRFFFFLTQENTLG